MSTRPGIREAADARPKTVPGEDLLLTPSAGVSDYSYVLQFWRTIDSFHASKLMFA